MKIRKSVVLITLLSCFAFIPPKKKFIDPANIDTSVRPGDDFFEYSNGIWMKKNPVPASKVRWGTIDVLRQLSSERMKSLLEGAAAAKGSEGFVKMLGDFYTSGMDSLNLEKLGYRPIEADLERVGRIKDVRGVLDEIAFQHANAVSYALFGFRIAQDQKNVSRYIPQFYQGGTTLPDRDYYLKEDNRSVMIRNEYRDHIRRSFMLIGTDSTTAANYSDVIIRIETTLAKSQLQRVELRDPYKTYNIFSVTDFSNTTPSIDWKIMLEKMGVNKPVDSIVSNNPQFFKTADVLLSALPVENWKVYLSWNVLRNSESLLSTPFVNEAFNFGKVLSGQKEQTPRWQRMSGLIDGTLGDAIGKLYVSEYFKPEAKERMLELVNNLQQTFASRIKRLDWMSPETKTRALEKLNAFTKKIAYPDKWKTYDGVVITKNDLVGNVRNASKWDYQEAIKRYGGPVDKTLWAMTPPTVNAYYSSSNNEIVFPAGILQFPFFDFAADDAVNYGSIAAVIGHEMTHGFDDQGRKYAADGNLKDWWTAEDAANFKKLADKVVAQYDAATVQDTIHVNGLLTLGENLADFGGLAMAYEAFTHTRQFKENKKIDGFTPAQRFFLGWAQAWRTNIRPEYEAQLILTDPHSPNKYRANIPPANMDAWYEAFGVKEGDKMFKPESERVKIW